MPESIAFDNFGNQWLLGETGCALFIVLNVFGMNAGSLSLALYVESVESLPSNIVAVASGQFCLDRLRLKTINLQQQPQAFEANLYIVPSYIRANARIWHANRNPQ
ncbi:hypothetical protein RvY_08340 [Ramazzottius varieornatus]|uniref:Uncharacterized protein n=1 Tax=Ramazzottius varieornatus TaxID=947166 RepID=A0A1D1VB66_RAMVA|nr:hypothetical protein RvY_08340 [Ramazzottius varieornatus]